MNALMFAHQILEMKDELIALRTERDALLERDKNREAWKHDAINILNGACDSLEEENKALRERVATLEALSRKHP